MTTYLGIDFSGDQKKWSPGTKNSNVWIAKVEMRNGPKLKLIDLRQVQEVEGEGRPFKRLCDLLRKDGFEAAGIDAPFSVPQKFINDISHEQLLKNVADIEKQGDFPKADDFFKKITGQTEPLEPKKPLRKTETYWKGKEINVRSTLWTGPRGGAAMTSACLTLLNSVGGPIWPWKNKNSKRLLVEAFPAAQLETWALPHEKYNGCNGWKNRKEIVKGLSKKIDFGNHKEKVIHCADALDAVICAFAGMAVKNKKLKSEKEDVYKKEGWIAVHKHEKVGNSGSSPE